MIFIFIAFLSFLITFVSIPYLIKIAFKIRLVDNPNGLLKSHEIPVAYLGGLSIFIGLLPVVFFYNFLSAQLIFSVIGLTCLLIVGLIDDAYVLSPVAKLTGQFLSVIFFLKAGLFINIYFLGNFFSSIFSILWILSIINAFNLIDVMDGLSSIVSLASSISFLILVIYLKQFSILIILLSFIASTFAFFLKNFPPAKIYLGDSGSLFIGGFFCVISLLINSTNQINDSVTAFIFPFMLFIPLLELFSLIIIRFFRGIPFFLGSKDHFSIYLKNNGWSNTNILLFTFFMQLFMGLVCVLFISNYLNIYWLVSIFLIQLLLWIYCMDYKKNVAF